MLTRKLIASTVAAATLAGGGLAVAALNPLSSAGAQEQAATAPSPSTDQPSGRTARHARGVLKHVLDDLVAKGTLTQAQADAVTDGVKAAVKDHRHDRRVNRREVVKLVADTIDIPVEDLVAALKDGQSIAEVAQARGVDPKTVTDAIVDHGTQRIDQAVANGKLDPARAEKLKARLPQLADRIVNHKRRA
jgi:polyhydroxyalkanoate synthesis regulator phasin